MRMQKNVFGQTGYAVACLVGAIVLLISAPRTALAALTPTHDTFTGTTASTHNAGGAATNFSGTGSAAFGPVGGDILSFEAPSPFPPSGGIFLATARSALFIDSGDLTDPDGNTLSLGPDEIIAINFSTLLIRNGATPTQTGSANLDSLLEFVVPDFGVGKALLFNAGFAPSVVLPNGGSASASGELTISNATTNSVLFTATSSATLRALIAAAPGDVLRFEFTGETSGTFPTGSSPFGQASVIGHAEFAVVNDPNFTGPVIPEPATATFALFALGGLLLRRRRTA